MEAESDVMNRIVIQEPEAQVINVSHTEAESDVESLIVKQVQ